MEDFQHGDLTLNYDLDLSKVNTGSEISRRW